MLNRLMKLLANLDEVQAQGGAGPGVNNIQREINALLRSMSPNTAARVRNATRATSAGSARAAHKLEVAAQEVHKKKPTRKSAFARRAAAALANERAYKREGGPSQYRLVRLTERKRKMMQGLNKELRKPPKRRRLPPLRKKANRNMTPPSRASSNRSYGNNKRLALMAQLRNAENEQNRQRIQALINQLNAMYVVNNLLGAEHQNLNSQGRGWGRMSGVERSRSKTPSSRSNTTASANSQKSGSTGSVTGPRRS
jgi:hypothetical protein